MTCKHPVIIGGKCVDCGTRIGGEKAAENAAAPQAEQTARAADEQPGNGQETPKKTTRKRKT